MNLANIQDLVGQELGVSEWETLDQQRIDQFAECTGDHQWIHVDVARARSESPVGSTIAHGYLTLSLLAKTSFDILVGPLGVTAGPQLRPRPRALHRAGEGWRACAQPDQAALGRRQGPGTRLDLDREHHRDRRRKQARADRRCIGHGDRRLSPASSEETQMNVIPNETPANGPRLRDVFAAAGKIGLQALKQPVLVLEQEATLARQLFSALGAQPESNPPKADKRFADPAWQSNPFYRSLLQGYTAWGDALGGFVDKSTMGETNKERARFVVSLLSGALAPTNTLLGNPAALKKMIDTGGTAWREACRNMLSDLASNRGMPAQVDKTGVRGRQEPRRHAGVGRVPQRGARTDPVRSRRPRRCTRGRS